MRDQTTIFEAQLVRADDDVVVSFRGELDMASGADAWAVLADAVTCGRRVVVDMSGLDFVDSTGLNMLVRARTIGGDSVPIVLRRPTAQLVRLLHAAGLHVDVE